MDGQPCSRLVSMPSWILDVSTCLVCLGVVWTKASPPRGTGSSLALTENISITCFGSNGWSLIVSFVTRVLSYTKSFAACRLPLGVAQKPRYRTGSDSGTFYPRLSPFFIQLQINQPTLTKWHMLSVSLSFVFVLIIVLAWQLPSLGLRLFLFYWK